jgi:hypothetical protein
MQPNVWLSNKQYKLPSQGVYGSNINVILAEVHQNEAKYFISYICAPPVHTFPQQTLDFGWSVHESTWY